MLLIKEIFLDYLNKSKRSIYLEWVKEDVYVFELKTLRTKYEARFVEKEVIIKENGSIAYSLRTKEEIKDFFFQILFEDAKAANKKQTIIQWLKERFPTLKHVGIAFSHSYGIGILTIEKTKETFYQAIYECNHVKIEKTSKNFDQLFESFFLEIKNQLNKQ